MSNFKDLEEFLSRQKMSEEEKKINWGIERDVFVNAVKSFYTKIEELLQPLSKKQLLTIEYVERYRVQEEYIGTYETPQMIIVFNGQRVTFTPVGTNIIGAYGRIDMQGMNGDVKFLWVPKNSDGPKISVTVTMANQPKPERQVSQPVSPEDRSWKIATPPPRIKFIDLNEDSFSDALMGVLRG